MDQSFLEYVQGTIEALLFVSDKPVMLEQFKEVLETVSSTDIKEALEDLKKMYTQKERGMIIVEIAGGYQMLSSPSYAMAIRRFYKTTHKEKLSKPALETLAIIAYKQPVARIDVELIRGVNSDGVVTHLLEKGLIKMVGRKEVPGRPFIYGTTQQFLEYFGLKSLDDLPKLEEFSLLQSVSEKEETSQTSDALQPVPVSATSEEIAVSSEEKDGTVASDKEMVSSSDTTNEPEVSSSQEEFSETKTIIQREVDTFLKQTKDFGQGEILVEQDDSSQSIDPETASEDFKRKQITSNDTVLQPSTSQQE